MNKNETTGKKVGRIIGRVMATIGTTLAAIFYCFIFHVMDILPWPLKIGTKFVCKYHS